MLIRSPSQGFANCVAGSACNLARYRKSYNSNPYLVLGVGVIGLGSRKCIAAAETAIPTPKEAIAHNCSAGSEISDNCANAVPRRTEPMPKATSGAMTAKAPSEKPVAAPRVADL